MKKNAFKKIMNTLAIASLCAAIAVGCGSKKNDVKPTSEPTKQVESQAPIVTVKPQASVDIQILEYFPFKENTLYKYVGEGIVDLNQESFAIYTRDNQMQRFTKSENFKVTDVFGVHDGTLFLDLGNTFYYMDSLLDYGKTMGTIVLQGPLEVGTKWQFDANESAEITSMNVAVETPYGKFDTMEVTSVDKDGNKRQDYYAKGVGLVKSNYLQGGSEATMSLSEIVENTSFPIDVNFYLVNSTTGQDEVEKRSLELKSNIDLVKYLETEMKKSKTADYEALIPEGASINEIVIDWQKSLAEVDLSKNYVEQLGVGAGIENSVLQAIVNTVGNFYGTDNVQITLDGKKYESGHITKEIGDYFKTEKPEEKTE